MKSMNAISRCQAQFRTERAVSDELGACHWAFIFAVSRCPGLTQEELAGELCLNKSTVTRALTYLEEHGFVIRQGDKADKRVLLIYPTEKTEALLPKLRAVTREWNELIAGGVNEEDLAVFLSVLYKMEKNAKSIISGEDRGACEK